MTLFFGAIAVASLTGCAAALVEGDIVAAVLERDLFISAVERRALIAGVSDAGALSAERRALLGLAAERTVLSAATRELGARFRVGSLPLRFRPAAKLGSQRIQIRGSISGKNYASFAAVDGETTIYDWKGTIVGRSRLQGERKIFHYLPRETKPWGYSVHDSESNIINHFEHVGAETKKVGFDLLLEDEMTVKHFDATGTQIGSTRISKATDGYTALVVGSIAATGSDKEKDEAAGKMARTAFLKRVFRPGIELSGRQNQGGNVWTFKLVVQAVNSRTGEFKGRIDYTNLGSVHTIEGQLVDDAFGFKETGIIKKGRSLLDSTHSFRLMPDGTVKGQWNSIERLWANWGNGKKRLIGENSLSGTESIRLPSY